VVARVGSRARKIERSESPQQRKGYIFVSWPLATILALLVGPMVVLAYMSFREFGIQGVGGFAGFDNYRNVLSDAGYLRILASTTLIASSAMLIMLLIAIPLAYVLAFRVGRFEVPLLLLLVLADQLNPLIRIYAWRTLLGREGIINSLLESIGLISQPIDALLYSRWAVIIVLTGTYMSFTTIPIYAAMKAIDHSLLEAAEDLGAHAPIKFGRILLPLAAPGIFVAFILVFIPLFSEFITPVLVGGTNGFMVGNAIQEQILAFGNWGVGSAMSFMLLILSLLLAAVAMRLTRLRQLETAA